MKTYLAAILIIFTLCACTHPEKRKIDLSQSNREFDIEGLKLITGQLGVGCKFEVIDFGMAMIGNNGRRSEEWFLDTCKGPMVYWVEYYPTYFFPYRISEYEATGRQGTPAERNE